MPTDSSRVFVIGVPRSGATLLRVSLHSPPGIATGPEMPWFHTHHPRTVGALVEYLRDVPICNSARFDGNREVWLAAARGFGATPLSSYSRRKGKRLWSKGCLDNPQFRRDPRRNAIRAPAAQGAQGHLIHCRRAAHGKWDAAGANSLISYGVPVPAACARISALRISQFK